VVLLFYPNDFFENVYPFTDLFPRIVRRGARIEVTRPSPDAFEAWLDASRRAMLRGPRRYSLLLDRMAEALGRLSAGERGAELARGFTAADLLPPDQALALTTSWLLETCQASGARLLLVYVPSLVEYERGAPSGVLALLATIAQRHSIELLDLTRVLSRDDYYLLDQHWRPSGHRRAAAAIAERLRPAPDRPRAGAGLD
jgi:hypothetical protein